VHGSAGVAVLRTADVSERRAPQTGAAAGRVALTATSWATRGELPIGEWAEHGRRLGAISRGVGWWLGDWLRYGNERFGERYARASRITGYDVQTLMNMVYVASRFDPSRRSKDLSFSHHAELAALEPADQDRWLARAARDRLSVRCLRDELRRERRLVMQEQASDHEGALEEAGRNRRDLVCPECGCRIRPRNLLASGTAEAAALPPAAQPA
jgi:hypothetical protein